MIVITGAAGFIGSAMAWMVETEDMGGIIAVDDWGADERWKNLVNRKIEDFVPREEFFSWAASHEYDIEMVIHMGAITDTMFRNVDYLLKNNYGYTKRLWRFCTETQTRLIYASSAAVYGNGSYGFSSSEENTWKLRPLNPYGYSKLIFDRWAGEQPEEPRQWVGLRFFNVYGPNEYHKDEMASMVFHCYNQVKEKGKSFLFKGYGEVPDGGHERDFVYIKDICGVIKHFIDTPDTSGIFNVGTGKARTFNDLAKAVFDALDMETAIRYIEMPEHLRPQYQAFTEADITRLREEAGYRGKFTSLEDGVADYVKNYLEAKKYF